MQHPSRLRQLTASVSITALLLGTWAPLAAAQSAPTPSGETRAAPSASSQAPSPTPAPPAAGSPEQAQPGAEDAADAASEGAHSAEEQREAARVAFEAGRAAFDDEDYARAYEQFAAAHERVPSPHAEYWMAASLDLQGGREAEAARAYQKFLAHPGAMHVGEDKVAEARQRLDELKAKLPARITIVTEPSGAQIAVNGVLQSGTSPLMLELPAGPHRIEATLPGRQRAEAELQLQGGDELEQRLLLPEEPTAAPAPPASEPPPPALEPSERSMLPAYITLGLAGAGLATGTVFGIQALSARSAYNDDPTASRADRVERNALIADMAFGIAITLGITGIVLLTSSDDAPQTAKAKKKQPTLAVAPVVAPQLGGAAARLTF